MLSDQHELGVINCRGSLTIKLADKYKLRGLLCENVTISQAQQQIHTQKSKKAKKQKSKKSLIE